MTLINNKIKQFFTGNWGKPKGGKQGVRVKALDVEPRRIRGKKKKRKGARRYIYKGHCCPFCHEELPLDEDRIAKAKKEDRGIIAELCRVSTCPNCKAIEIKECPACKRKTWYRQGWHKHQVLGCGFEGKKLELGGRK